MLFIGRDAPERGQRRSVPRPDATDGDGIRVAVRRQEVDTWDGRGSEAEDRGEVHPERPRPPAGRRSPARNAGRPFPRVAARPARRCPVGGGESSPLVITADPAVHADPFPSSEAASTRRGPAVAVVNETLARQHWPDGDPLTRRVSVQVAGQGFILETFEAEIVGVVGTVRPRGFDSPPPPRYPQRQEAAVPASVASDGEHGFARSTSTATPTAVRCAVAASGRLCGRLDARAGGGGSGPAGGLRLAGGGRDPRRARRPRRRRRRCSGSKGRGDRVDVGPKSGGRGDATLHDHRHVPRCSPAVRLRD